MRLVDAETIEKEAFDENGMLLSGDEKLKNARECCYVSLQDIDNAPTIYAEPVVLGQWISDPKHDSCMELDDDNFLKHYKCSRCGRRVSCLAHYDLLEDKPYCHCGAKMCKVVEE